MIKTERYLIFVGEQENAFGGIDDLLMITDDYQSDFLNHVTEADGEYTLPVQNNSKIYNQYLVYNGRVVFEWFEIFDLETKEEVEVVFWKPIKK